VTKHLAYIFPQGLLPHLVTVIQIQRHFMYLRELPLVLVLVQNLQMGCMYHQEPLVLVQMVLNQLMFFMFHQEQQLLLELEVKPHLVYTHRLAAQ
jgi:hypothetical protein